MFETFAFKPTLKREQRTAPVTFNILYFYLISYNYVKHT